MSDVWREVNVRCMERSDLDIGSEVVIRHKFEGKLKITMRREVVV